MGIKIYKNPFTLEATGWGFGAIIVCLFGFAVMLLAEFLKVFGVG